jgi:hypothetical protein
MRDFMGVFVSEITEEAEDTERLKHGDAEGTEAHGEDTLMPRAPSGWSRRASRGLTWKKPQE